MKDENSETQVSTSDCVQQNLGFVAVKLLCVAICCMRICVCVLWKSWLLVVGGCTCHPLNLSMNKILAEVKKEFILSKPSWCLWASNRYICMPSWSCAKICLFQRNHPCDTRCSQLQNILKMWTISFYFRCSWKYTHNNKFVLSFHSSWWNVKIPSVSTYTEFRYWRECEFTAGSIADRL